MMLWVWSNFHSRIAFDSSIYIKFVTKTVIKMLTQEVCVDYQAHVVFCKLAIGLLFAFCLQEAWRNALNNDVAYI